MLHFEHSNFQRLDHEPFGEPGDSDIFCVQNCTWNGPGFVLNVNEDICACSTSDQHPGKIWVGNSWSLWKNVSRLGSAQITRLNQPTQVKFPRTSQVPKPLKIKRFKMFPSRQTPSRTLVPLRWRVAIDETKALRAIEGLHSARGTHDTLGDARAASVGPILPLLVRTNSKTVSVCQPFCLCKCKQTKRECSCDTSFAGCPPAN